MSTTGNGHELPWQEAGKGSRACKFGFYGPTGSGKTTTAAIVARYIAQQLGKKQAYMIDSENGADFVESLFRKAKIKLNVIRTREFGLLTTTFTSMHDSDEVILVDSVTHFSDDIAKNFLRASHRNRLRLQDFAVLYETWREFSEPFVTSHLNTLVCGRQGNIYENVVNEQGELEFYKSDTKFRASDQFGHEPDLLLQMEQVVNADGQMKLEQATSKVERAKIAAAFKRQSQVNIVATVRKDRTRLLMGAQFTFTPGRDDAVIATAVEQAFKPVVDWHLRNETQAGLTETGSTRAMLTPAGNEFEWQEQKRRKDFAIDEVKETLTKYFPGMTAKEKQAKIEVSERIFGVKSWEGICQKDLEILEAAIKSENGTPSLIERACIEKSEVAEAEASKS